MKLHLGHSKSRFSLRSGAGDTRDKFIRVRQREQYGRSIGIRDEVMMLTLDQGGALPDSLSPNTAEDGSVIDKFYSRHVRESIQIKAAALHPLMYLTNQAVSALACWTRDNAPATFGRHHEAALMATRQGPRRITDARCRSITRTSLLAERRVSEC
jgi:hypothetical protein